MHAKFFVQGKKHTFDGTTLLLLSFDLSSMWVLVLGKMSEPEKMLEGCKTAKREGLSSQ
jgi:hypothetical protein